MPGMEPYCVPGTVRLILQMQSQSTGPHRAQINLPKSQETGKCQSQGVVGAERAAVEAALLPEPSVAVIFSAASRRARAQGTLGRSWNSNAVSAFQGARAQGWQVWEAFHWGLGEVAVCPTQVSGEDAQLGVGRSGKPTQRQPQPQAVHSGVWGNGTLLPLSQ